MGPRNVIVAGIALAAATAASGVQAPKPADAVRARAEASLKGLVKQAERRDRNLSSVGLFTAAFNLLRANRSLDKLDVLFDVAAEMQERTTNSPAFGNFRWYWRDGYVMDHNAVDFCMQEGALIARDWRGSLTPAQRGKFERLCAYAITGSLNHRVRSAYTNIAIMNAVNLVLLGEAFGRKDVFDEGVKRLDDFLLTTALFGVCEYSSPTYTAVDVSGLLRLRTFARDAGVQDRAERLLRLFWSDLAASSFTPSGRLAGAHSRDYDYLFGHGMVAPYLRAAGLAPKLPGAPETPPLPFELASWRPGADIRALASATPRYVESMWGEEEEKVRTQWTGRNVSLGVAGANYWNMDIPLAVDFASTNRIPRAYFIADGRRDPYGIKKIPEGTGPHQKTLHLKPFWAGVQRGRDALGIAVYRASDVPPGTPTLESHIVFPSQVDDVYVNDERVSSMTEDRPCVRGLDASDAVFVRLGEAVCGVRVPWTRDRQGGRARIALVQDGTVGVRAFRLTVAHHDAWGLPSGTQPPGAAFWVRVADRAGDAAAFAAFRRAFRSAVAAAVAGDAGLDLSAAGLEGRLALAAAAPYLSVAKMEPAPRRAVLAVNGHDLGAEILGEVAGVGEYRRELARMKAEMADNRIAVMSRRTARWEAETGVVQAEMAVGTDPQAREGKFVWAPGEVGGRGHGSGRVSWQLDVKDAGIYHLWARVNAPSPEDDSFFIGVRQGSFEKVGLRGPVLLANTEWHTPKTGRLWGWAEFPTPLELPEGPVVLTLYPREDGAKMDCLCLSGDAAFEPQD